MMTRREGDIIKQPEIQGWESLGKGEEQWSEGGMRTQGRHPPPPPHSPDPLVSGLWDQNSTIGKSHGEAVTSGKSQAFMKARR